jgi:ATP phosphoribosyltransferase regulatory subunit HisZ
VELRIDLAEFADQTVDPRLRPGLEGRAYYDGLVFRAFGGRAAEPLGGGGRYDRLFHRLGAEVTAAGFSLSLDRLTGRGDAVSAGAEER